MAVLPSIERTFTQEEVKEIVNKEVESAKACEKDIAARNLRREISLICSEKDKEIEELRHAMGMQYTEIEELKVKLDKRDKLVENALELAVLVARR